MKQLEELRNDPFYYYLVARTRYYDQVVLEAVAEGIRQIVGIGCGSDTRSHRFMPILKSHGIDVLECDQPRAIRAKERLTRRWSSADNVDYLPLDLNDGAWPELERWLQTRRSRTLVMLEGVSPYINDDAFGCFLNFLAEHLAQGSDVAYDFKLQGVRDDFGRGEQSHRLFRMSGDQEEVRAFHESRRYILRHLELSEALSARLIDSAAAERMVHFAEDGLVRLKVRAPER
jgi:methyltransferase (TIGR00027 family)